MAGGTLVVSRRENLFPHYKKRFEQLGFVDVTVTGVEKDGLYMLINELKPRLLLIGSAFHHIGTLYMTGELHRRFPKLNIAVISVGDFPPKLAPWFIWYGARSFVDLWEGLEEFYRGLQMVREGRQYISPLVQDLIDRQNEWPDTKGKATKRLMECLIMLCCGLEPEEIGKELHICRRTVYGHLDTLYGIFHAKNRVEMVALAWTMGLVTPEDIKFYSRRPEGLSLPKWAKIKMSMNKERAGKGIRRG